MSMLAIKIMYELLKKENLTEFCNALLYYGKYFLNNSFLYTWRMSKFMIKAYFLSMLTEKLK